MPRHIHSMTTEQTRRVCAAVLALTRDWLLGQGAADGRYGGAAAFADFNRDCYVGIVKVEYSVAGGEAHDGEIEWRLDHRFEPVGEPDVRFSEGRRPL